ncbi:glutathione peroxidase [Anaerocolumna cellulosilytica]|uniref:Glutathione peroxidase n=1 Tax=Anaerocolumna cellulosilytica TaxID=433286 RepID=A0A6S6R537_9FIRM|nr:glutathione peroxidase [Anaerocolumna cellulosilytica]MBB5194257.1 glutathione peroxidase [Anaerocolumna cellulosilytica]BCJ94530.1 glutathione peroxidase [Anaerocolumna cellulosilytica]
MSVYDFSVLNIAEEEVSLKKYEGQVLLIINSATKCGFTPQYDELQDLYEKYSKDGFVILDFPCNQFGNQAPGTNEEILSFCDAKFGITFPMFSKIEVNGEEAHPLFQYLVKEKGFGGFNEDHELSALLNNMLSGKDPDYDKKPSIKWNFTKFLIDRNGNVVERFEPTESISVVEDKIKSLL